MDRFDYVIVGAGSSGSVLTNRLSEDREVTVCVLEAGPRDWHPYIHLPAGFIKTFHMKSINWAYQQEVGPWTGGGRRSAPRGAKRRSPPPPSTSPGQERLAAERAQLALRRPRRRRSGLCPTRGRHSFPTRRSSA